MQSCRRGKAENFQTPRRLLRFNRTPDEGREWQLRTVATFLFPQGCRRPVFCPLWVISGSSAPAWAPGNPHDCYCDDAERAWG